MMLKSVSKKIDTKEIPTSVEIGIFHKYAYIYLKG